MPSIEVLVFAPLITLLAYVIFGISGFGSTLIAVPLLAHLFPLTFVVPMVVLLDCISAIGMGTRLRQDVNRRELTPLLPFLVVGMIAGVVLLLKLPAQVLLATLGIFIFAFGLNFALRRESPLRFPRWSAGPVGLFAGTTSSTLGVGGPIYVTYLAGRGATPDEIRATVPVIFIFTTIARIALFSIAGLFNTQVLLTAASLLPVMGLGLWIGNRLHGRLSREQAIRIVGALLIVSGASLLARAASAG